MKTILCVIIMLTITPIAAVTGLISYDPSRWGGEMKIENILVMAVFGLITVQVWLTYIPALIFTPIIMKRLSGKEVFHTIPRWKFYLNSILYGAGAGIFILLPCVLLSVGHSLDITLNWLWAGCVAGGITFPIISTLYRLIKPRKLQEPSLAS
ncbi:MAG: hypothetical protein OEM02_17420 [Desulfobulbaceae bacterium]|nr:hypothetical protein [Desulfobulbaceae bacterium]